MSLQRLEDDLNHMGIDQCRFKEGNVDRQAAHGSRRNMLHTFMHTMRVNGAKNSGYCPGSHRNLAPSCTVEGKNSQDIAAMLLDARIFAMCGHSRHGHKKDRLNPWCTLA